MTEQIMNIVLLNHIKQYWFVIWGELTQAGTIIHWGEINTQLFSEEITIIHLILIG